MAIMTSEWEERLSHWIRTLQKDFFKPLSTISWKAAFTRDLLPLSEAEKLPFKPVEPGFSWGHSFEYGWFYTEVTLPEESAGKRIVLQPGIDEEATLFVDGQAFGTHRAGWVKEPHQMIEDNTLTRDGEPGRKYTILMEVYAGHRFPTNAAPHLQKATGPILHEDFEEDNLPEGARCRLGHSSIGIWNEDAYKLYMDVMTLAQLLQTLDENSLRAAKIADALEEFTLTVDFEQDEENRCKDYRAARKLLRPLLSAKNGSTMPTFSAVGNAHIDLAWLWPFEETYRKTARTFAAQLRLMDEYPDYRFIQSQPALYEMCREHYPALFERIREKIKDGQWIADGAMWVEPDTNMTSGESLIRQLLYGKKYYRDVLGVESTVLWLPDSFGYTAALPQILKGCGVRYLVTQKIFWSYNNGDSFPCHYFSWEGMDGTKILTFLPTSYTYDTSPAEANEVWEKRTQKRDLDAFLFPFGYGDGGGGPCRDHIEYAERMKDLEGSVKMKMESPAEFFEKMDQTSPPVHTYVGELYLTAHRGTYTTQAEEKKGNRKSELLMRDLEYFCALASLFGHPYPAADVERLWKVVLLHQFHDILPGSSIAKVYEEAQESYQNLTREAEAMIRDATDSLKQQEEGITVWNTLGFSRNAVVTLPESFRYGAKEEENVLPVFDGENGFEALVSLPPMGSVTLYPAEKKEAHPEKESPVMLREKDGNYIFENQKLRAVLNARAEVISFRLKEDNGSLSGFEFVKEPMNRLKLFKSVPRRYDAWDIDSNYIRQEIPDAAREIRCQILFSSGLKAVLLVTGVVGNSPYTQEILLESESSRLVFRTHIDWQERHRILKAAFPSAIYAENGINEMQFGYVERPTHRSRPYEEERFEVCNHRYSALCDANAGVAVLNDCKYGISMNGGSLELTLLTAATCPDPHADQGGHDFTYAFTAWKGTFFASDVAKQGYELNVAPVVTEGGREPFSAFFVSDDNIIPETLKCAEDESGDLILRLYESKKAATDTELAISLPSPNRKDRKWTVSECDLTEQEQKTLPVKNGKVRLSFRPFEIKTLRLHCE